jgi:hypothetical protein
MDRKLNQVNRSRMKTDMKINLEVPIDSFANLHNKTTKKLLLRSVKYFD